MKRLVPLNWIQWLSLVTVVVFALVLPFILVRVEDAHRDTNTTIRTLLCYFEARSLASPVLTTAQKRKAVTTYNAALGQINEPPCG